MFSASLLSMMARSVEGLPVNMTRPVTLSDSSQLAGFFQTYANDQIPVVARSDDAINTHNILEKNRVTGASDGKFIWGRIHLEGLVRVLTARHDIPASREFIDLGTPFTMSSGVSNAFISDCDALLRNTTRSTA